MSDTLGESLIRNLINLGLDDSFTRISRPFPPKSISSEQLSDEVIGWSGDSWCDKALRKPQYPFKPDRSMSLTDSCLKMKPHSVPPPPGFEPLPSNRFKTELCRSFQEHGSCKYGNKCQFAHGEGELRGLHRHPKYKTQECRTFYQFGYCPYGPRCHFIHEERSPLAGVNAPGDQHPRLRQSVSFAGFSRPRSSSPPSLYDPLSFTRASSVSPPPADILSPVFTDSSREMFPFGRYLSGENHSSTPYTTEPKSRCVCGHGNNVQMKEERKKSFVADKLQRFPSEDSLSDRESYSSTGSSSGSESPTFDSLSGKRLSVFARMSVSD
ncbi:mRNA decay activator protein ZFP36L2-like [Xyrauchen texanus]|uniref:mRNA decay activator protein ZFP36L2-like n=1 Tax=Xyrauchen texanus TaxID=154827 RepID=UPI002241D5D5|nr:mRNA decay activator protein ZFP36L2-like [Xyrauchen texanus]